MLAYVSKFVFFPFLYLSYNFYCVFFSSESILKDIIIYHLVLQKVISHTNCHLSWTLNSMDFLFQPVRNETATENQNHFLAKTKANCEGQHSVIPDGRMLKHMGSGRSVHHSHTIAALSTSNLWKAPISHQSLFKKVTYTHTFWKLKMKI